MCAQRTTTTDETTTDEATFETAIESKRAIGAKQLLDISLGLAWPMW